MSIPRYSCIASALTTSAASGPPSSSTTSSARSDLPVAVGPTTVSTGWDTALRLRRAQLRNLPTHPPTAQFLPRGPGATPAGIELSAPLGGGWGSAGAQGGD